ncbi:MAG: hypothetical protein JWP20_1472 [Roseomonas sp.]|nr:hypothetical protein [Roseomonas sp.]
MKRGHNLADPACCDPRMSRRSWVALGLLSLLAGCTTPPPQTTLTQAATRLDSNPVRAAIRGAATVFADPGSVAGKPREAAIAVAQLEFLAVEIMAKRTNLDLSGIVGPSLQGARSEVRDYLSIPAPAAPQEVIDALLATPPALAQPAIFTAGPEETLRRLSALPRLPQANAATSMALEQMEFGLQEIDISMR